MDDTVHNVLALLGKQMNSIDIVPSDHARMQMQRRRITLEDMALVLRFGDHEDGVEEGTREA